MCKASKFYNHKKNILTTIVEYGRTEKKIFIMKYMVYKGFSL